MNLSIGNFYLFRQPRDQISAIYRNSQPLTLWMQIDHSTSIQTLLDSLNALDPYRQRFDRLAMGHGTQTTPADYIDRLKACAEDLIRTGGEGDEQGSWFGGVAYHPRFGENDSIFYTKDKL